MTAAGSLSLRLGGFPPAAVLRSAAAAGALWSASITTLVLMLNPGLSPSEEAAPLAMSVALPYALVGTGSGLVLVVCAAAVRWWPRDRQPPIPGMPWLTTLASVATASAAGLYWYNGIAYRDSLSLETVTAIAWAAGAQALTSAVLAAVGLARLAFRYRPLAAAPPAVVLTCGLAVAWPLALRPTPAAAMRPPERLSTEPSIPERRVILVGVDGIGADALRADAASGRLPEFANLLERGVFARLRALQPTEGPPVWTTIVTGHTPRVHGVKSFRHYHLAGSEFDYELFPKALGVQYLERTGLISTAAVTAGSRRRTALWSAVNALGIQAGVVRLWATHPAERISGFMLSNAFYSLRDDPERVMATLHPPDLLEEVRSRLVDENDTALTAPYFGAGAVSTTSPGLEERILARALAADLSYKRAGDVLRAAYDPALYAIYFYGADVVGHTFTRYSRPELFGDVDHDRARRYGDVLRRYQARLGEWVGDYAGTLGPDDVLLVVSGHGMRPETGWRPALSKLLGGTRPSGTHVGGPDGFVLALGNGLRRGIDIGSVAAIDVAPTVLYLMGLPIGRDMPGRALVEILEDGAMRRRPVTFIPSYESLAPAPEPPGRDDDVPLPTDADPVASLDGHPESRGLGFVGRRASFGE